MRINKKTLFILIFTLLISTVLWSKIEVRVYTDHNNIPKNETFQLIIEISGAKTSDISQPILPNIPFENLGISTNDSYSITVVNGKVSKLQKSSFIYNLRALKSGTFKIPPISVNIDNAKYKSNACEVHIVKAESSKQGQASNASDSYGFETNENIKADDIFVVSEASKKLVYKNEPIFLNYVIYSKYNIKIKRLGDDPNYNGFWKEEPDNDGRISLQQTKYKGKKYYYAVLKTLVLSPNKTGTLTIPPFTLYVDALVTSGGFWGFTSAKPLKLTSKSFTIKSLELPSPPPNQKFSGAVGKFSLEAELSPTSLKAGETAMLTLTIKGSGNLKQSENPRFSNISKLKVLDPEVENKVSFDNEVYSSIRKIKYAILPQEEGIYQIPALEFSYFDPDKKAYISKLSPEYKIEVQRGNIVLTGNNIQKNNNKEDSDIGFIITSLSIKKHGIFFQSFYYWFFIALLFISIPAHYLYKLEQDKLSSNLEYLRNRTASKILKRYLKEASTAYHHQHSDQFYDAASKGILLYLADKTSISRGSTQSEILDKLKDYLSDEILLHELELFIEKCSQYKYMPNKENNYSLRSDYHQLKNIVTRLTKMIR